MRTRSTLLRLAAILLLVSALVHVVALVAGPAGSVAVAACAALVLLGLGLLKELRWVAWIAFFVALADGIAAMGSAVAAAAGPDPVCLAVAVCDWLAALVLFAYLWRPPGAGPAGG